jgi:hypothetical protein
LRCSRSCPWALSRPSGRCSPPNKPSNTVSLTHRAAP